MIPIPTLTQVRVSIVVLVDHLDSRRVALVRRLGGLIKINPATNYVTVGKNELAGMCQFPIVHTVELTEARDGVSLALEATKEVCGTTFRKFLAANPTNLVSLGCVDQREYLSGMVQVRRKELSFAIITSPRYLALAEAEFEIGNLILVREDNLDTIHLVESVRHYRQRSAMRRRIWPPTMTAMSVGVLRNAFRTCRNLTPLPLGN